MENYEKFNEDNLRTRAHVATETRDHQSKPSSALWTVRWFAFKPHVASSKTGLR
jgi:hypothetical protein